MHMKVNAEPDELNGYTARLVTCKAGYLHRMACLPSSSPNLEGTSTQNDTLTQRAHVSMLCGLSVSGCGSWTSRAYNHLDEREISHSAS